MTLEDFFTLTEMKGGLACLSRVEELVSLMRKQKDYVINNLNDTARQWSIVAHTISATDNSDCLDHFIHLNGLWFLDQWLQEAQRCNGSTTESYIEESIKALLGAVQKLPLDKGRTASSGIGTTVKHLCGHKSLEIQDRAKALLESWNEFENTDTKLTVVGECPETLITNASSSKTASEGTYVAESAASGFQHSAVTIISDGFTAQDGKAPITNQEAPGITSDNANAKNGLPANGQKSSGTTSSGASVSLVPRARVADKEASDVSELKDLSDSKDGMEIEMHASDDTSSKSSERETCTVPMLSSGLKEPGSFYAQPANKCASESSPKKTASATLDNKNAIEESQPKSEDSGGQSGNEGTPRKQENPGASPLQGMEASGTVGEGQVVRESGSKISIEGSLTPIGLSYVLERRMDWRDSEVMDGRASGSVFGYEEDDPLEVARQVAQEVEREVETYRDEPMCSSSEKNAEEELMQCSSPDSVQGKQEEPMMELQDNRNETPIEPEVPTVGPLKEETSLDRDYIKPEEPESSQLVSIAQEPVPEVDKGRCIFDLNEDVLAEEGDCTPIPFTNPPGNLSAPVAVVAASKGTLGLPATPLQFKGELGWRGSAATSAFRPASPWKTLDNEKTFSVEASNQRQHFLKIDLNIAEGDGDDEAVMDLMSARPIPVSSSVPSGDDSIEVTSRREERLKLDLNRLGDNEDGPDWRVDGQLHRYQNGNRSPSPASSSSSRQPSMRDIDLNDNPSFFDPCSHDLISRNEKSSQMTNVYRGFRLDDPIISMMGPRMEVDRMEFAHSAHSFLVNGQGTFSPMSRVAGGGGGQPALAYAAPPPPPFGYNAMAMAPPMSLPQGVYAPGPVPYMMDSRGATVIPQIMGSPAAVSSSYSRPPFIMSMTGSPSSHGVGRAILDLNSGMGSTDGTVRESGGLRQLFIQGQNGLMEDQAKLGSQLSGSGATLKRKEPDCGWDPYTLGYKQAASWN